MCQGPGDPHNCSWIGGCCGTKINGVKAGQVCARRACRLATSLLGVCLIGIFGWSCSVGAPVGEAAQIRGLRLQL